MPTTYTKVIRQGGLLVPSAHGGLELVDVLQVHATDSGTGARVVVEHEDLEEMQTAGALPKITDSREVYYGTGTWSTSNLRATLRARSIEILTIEKSAGVVTARIRWGTRYVKDPEEGTVWLPWAGSFYPQVRRLPIWRRLGSATAPTLSGPGTTDIGGTKLDVVGDPVDAAVSEGIFVASGWCDTFVGSKSTDITNITNNMYKLNSATLFGLAAYTLRVIDWTIENEEDEYYTLRTQFHWSALGHCEQVPLRDPDGKVIVSGSPLQATTVYWRRDSNEAVDFSTRWTAFERHRIEKGLGVAYP